MFSSNEYESTPLHDLARSDLLTDSGFSMMFRENPQFITQQDQIGNTPLHYIFNNKRVSPTIVEEICNVHIGRRALNVANPVAGDVTPVDIIVGASTILGFVGAGGIGEALKTNISWSYEPDIMAIMALLVITITALDYLSTYIRNKLIGGIQL